VNAALDITYCLGFTTGCAETKHQDFLGSSVISVVDVEVETLLKTRRLT